MCGISILLGGMCCIGILLGGMYCFGRVVCVVLVGWYVLAVCIQCGWCHCCVKVSLLLLNTV